MKKSIKILIVENSNHDYNSTCRILEQSKNYKFVIKRAQNKSQTLKLCKSFKPNCLLMNYRIDGSNGLTLLKEIYAEHGEYKIASIFTADFGTEELVAEIMKSGAYDYIPKNKITSSKLITSIINSLEKAKRKRAILKKQTNLQESLISMKKKLELKSRFFASMSHEIRTPLNGIVGFIEILLSQIDDGEEKEYLKICRESAKHLEYLVNDLLDFSKIEAGKLALENHNFELKKCFDKTVNIFTTQGTNVKLVWKGKNTYLVKGDSHRLTQILNNLVSNAIKFSSNNSEVKIEVNLVEEECNLKINCKIIDQGIGIPEDKLDKVFDAFTQAESSTTREYGGTGLGLGIIRHIIELMGGNVGVKSEVGKGSTFSFNIELPIITNEKTFKVLSKKPNLKTILIAEDNDINCKLMEAIFKDSEYKLIFAKNGEKAVQYFKENDINLILMDINMPILDGYDTTLEIRKENKDIPILALSADNSSEYKEKIKNSGMNDYLSKPIDKNKLLNKISEFID